MQPGSVTGGGARTGGAAGAPGGMDGAGSVGMEEKIAGSSVALEQARHEALLGQQQQARLEQEKETKRRLWEAEQQRERDYQRQLQKGKDAQRRSIGVSQVYPD